MKNTALAIFCLVFMLAVSSFHAFGLPAHEKSFNDVEGKEWILAELRSAGNIVRMDRQKLQAEDLGGVYTIVFQAERDSNGSRESGKGQAAGMGAPNRFFGPYTTSENRSLSIGNLASTLMMAFREPDGLKEHEYFNYLSKVTRWELREEKLELYSVDGGNEVVLVFNVK